VPRGGEALLRHFSSTHQERRGQLAGGGLHFGRQVGVLDSNPAFFRVRSPGI